MFHYPIKSPPQPPSSLPAKNNEMRSVNALQATTVISLTPSSQEHSAVWTQNLISLSQKD